MAKKFPKVLYVKIEQERDGTYYFNPADSVLDLAEMGERHKIGVYKLTSTTTVEGVVRYGPKHTSK
jgi:hypothetical protein